jgi:short-subunit dehydrogenase
MENKLNYALVTGGSSGIGFELAKLLAKDGYNLVIVARDEDGLRHAADAIKQENAVEVITLSQDLFDPENAFEVFRELRDRQIEVEILVNDAGQGQYGEFVDTDIHRELDIINLNISSLVVLTKLFLREMMTMGRGRILNVSSIASKAPGPWHSVYHGTKAFVQSFTEAIRSEMKDTGITITALLPGATATDFFNKAGMNESKIVQEGKLDDAAKVAKDGYDALMSGDDKVVSGLKNKMQVAMSSITPDAKAADMMKKQQQPADLSE